MLIPDDGQPGWRTFFEIGEFCIKNDEFCIKKDEFNANIKAESLGSDTNRYYRRVVQYKRHFVLNFQSEMHRFDLELLCFEADVFDLLW